MKSFLKFLAENKVDEEIVIDGNEEYFKFDESGDVTGIDTLLNIDWQDYREFFEGDVIGESDMEDYPGIEDYGKPGTTFGNELIIDLNLDDFKELTEKKKDDNDDYDDTRTLTFLKKRNVKNIDDVKKNAFQYTVEPSNANPKDGDIKISRRIYDEPESTKHQLTDDEIDEIVTRKNTPPPKPISFDFDENGNLLGNGKKIKSQHKIGFLKKLNTVVDKIHKKTGSGILRHYKWEVIGDIKKRKDGSDMKGSNLGNHLLVNVTDWDDSDKEDMKRFDTAEYKLVETPEEKEELKSYINKIQKAPKEKGVLGWDGTTFTLNDKPLYGEDLLDFIAELNANITLDKKQEGFNEIGSYWKHFKISTNGSKVGDVANFSLPPVMTCNHDAPCINDGCYAVKAYGMYPTSRIAQEVNYALLKEGKYDQLKKEIGSVLKLKSKKGPKFEYFRFFVSGDLPSKEMLKTICEIAEENGKIKFWLYTKQYALLHKYSGTIPGNLTILVSCWGEFCPALYKDGAYAELEDRFPLAYLDDGTENTSKFFKKKNGDIVCPCTEDDEVVAHCDKCHKCFTARAKKGNIIFKKH